MVVSVSKNELTPKVMLPGCAIKPVDGGEYQSFNIYSKEKIREILLNREADISSKIRCLFFGRFHGDEESSEILIKSLSYSDSVLYRHEVLYVLGQMGLKSPLDHLYNILGDFNEHPMVRHEAGEAIAAIGDISSIDIIEKYLNDDSPAVRETCYLAQHSLKMKSMKKEESGRENDNLLYFEGESNDCNNISDFNAFNTKDPTPPNKSCETTQIESLVLDLLNGEMHLEKRYGALFALRNILTGVINSNQRSNLISNNLKYKNGDEMVNYIANKIAEAMEYDNKSAVFRHECAFVLGQVQVISTADSLSRVVGNIMEESMVRHEAAFALGSVGSTDPRFCTHTESDDLFNYNKDDVKRIRKLAIETLTKFSNDPDIIVAESCIVGLQTIIDETGTLEIEI